MNLPLRRLAIVLFVAFAVLVGGLTYSQVIAGPRYRDDSRNARVVLDQAGRERGGIITADGVVVAESVAAPQDPRYYRRSYPQGALYAHVVGYASPLLDDRGVEEARGSTLSSERDATISGLLSALAGDDLRAHGLRLTINHGLQQAASEALGDRAGSVVVIDPSTGAILAMVSKPDFDPNLLVGLDATVAGEALEADPGRPLLNRSLQETYPPGSTFKVVTAASAIEAGNAGPETTYPNPAELQLPGTTATIRNFDDEPCGPGDRVSLETAFVRSCNTIFGMVGMETGAGDLVGRATAFGFNQDVPFDLDAVQSVIPEAAAFRNDDPALAQTALGQRDVRATPLQMALAAAAVANGGVIMTPYLVQEVINADGEVTSTTGPTEWRRAISPATARVLAGLMEEVVTSGTGRQAAVAGASVAGKTGTAEIPERAPHAWFIGFTAPLAERGPIAFAVLVESGGEAGEAATGGSVAAPIAAAVVSSWLNLEQE